MEILLQEQQGEGPEGAGSPRAPAVTDETVGIAPPAVLTPFQQGGPASVGLPTFVVGAIALGLALVGYVPGTGAAIPIILVATGLGQLVTCIWAIALGESDRRVSLPVMRPSGVALGN
jgi:hypothetical protein